MSLSHVSSQCPCLCTHHPRMCSFTLCRDFTLEITINGEPGTTDEYLADALDTKGNNSERSSDPTRECIKKLVTSKCDEHSLQSCAQDSTK